MDFRYVLAEAQEHGRLRGREAAVTEHRANLREFCAWLSGEYEDDPETPRGGLVNGAMVVAKLRELGLWVDP